MARLGWVDSDYTWLTGQIVAVAERHAKGRIVSLLEGGYVLPALARASARACEGTDRCRLIGDLSGQSTDLNQQHGNQAAVESFDWEADFVVFGGRL